MPIRSNITDSKTGNKAHVFTPFADEKHPPNGLVVYSEPRKIFDESIQFFINPTQGIDMNKDAGSGGTPKKIHNGTDSVEWTGSILSGGAGAFVFDSTDQAKAGTKSVDATPSRNGNEALFTDGTTTDISGYVSLSGFIYITGWSTSGIKEVQIRARLSGTNVGNTIDLSSYIDTGVFNSWEKFTILKADLGLNTQTIDELVIETIDSGAGAPPNYYLDDLQWEQTGSPIIYEIKPLGGIISAVTSLQIIMAGAYTGIVTVAGATENATMSSLSYDQLLGVSTLATGFTVRVKRRGEIRFSNNIKQLSDLLQIPNMKRVNSTSDGTNTLITLSLSFESHPVVLLPDFDDKITVTINDDMSGLLLFRMSARILEEKTS